MEGLWPAKLKYNTCYISVQDQIERKEELKQALRGKRICECGGYIELNSLEVHQHS